MTQVRRPRVALVAHGIHDRGGMERAFAELIRRAHDRCDFEVFAAELAPELRPMVTWHRILVPSRPIPLKFVAFFVRAAVPIARADFDVVHVLGAIIPNRADLATVQHCHAGFRTATGRLAPASAPLVRRVNTALERVLALVAERWCYRAGRIRALAAVSADVVRELETHYPGVPIVVTPNGVDAERFRPDQRSRSVLRREEGRGDADIVALFVGGNWDLKGLAIAVEAVAQVVPEVQLHLWVVGRGDRDRFAKLARARGVEDRIRFFGPQMDTRPFYQAADVFVLPTAYEAASLVLCEAAASCLAIIATRVNGVRDLVVDGESGLLVEREIEAVAVALTQLAKDPALRERMGQQARQRASAYTWDRSARSVIALYEQLLDGAGELPA